MWQVWRIQKRVEPGLAFDRWLIKPAKVQVHGLDSTISIDLFADSTTLRRIVNTKCMRKLVLLKCSPSA